MTTTTQTLRISTRSVLFGALAAVMLLAALLIGAQTASAQQGPGPYCVQTLGGNSCTANDVRISNLTPTIEEACLVANQPALVSFRAEVVSTASTRYDIGFYIATDGGSAYSGAMCYHDYLKPPSQLGNTDLSLLDGDGPFRNMDSNVCADIVENDGPIFYDLAPITILCTDANNDGIVDPLSTCTSWKQNSGVCTDVTGAVPGTPSKCNCEPVPISPSILIYKGLDGGDLPESYGTLFGSSVKYPEGGARHAIQDPTGTGSPKTQGGQVAIWLGNTVDYAWANPTDETTAGGFPHPDALGDDQDNIDDEDGVAFPAPWFAGVGGGKIQFSVNASGPGECTVGNDCTVVLWLDWDGSGDFTNTLFSAGGERYEFPLTGGTGTNYLRTFDTPDTWTVGAALAARVRLYDNAPGSPAYSPVGLVTNGEVEDYIAPLGTLSVTLNDFSAVCQADTPLITWDTVSEVETQGFNLLRGTSADGWDTQLNPTLIEAQNPGNTQGGSYQWLDTTALPDVEYFYWLQDVSFNNVTGLHGPISATCLAPTAVGLSSLGANTPASSALTWWATALAMAALLLGVIIWQRQAQKR